MKGHGAKFGRKQEEAIAALLIQRNVDEAARSIGVAANTLLKWMKLSEVQKAYRDARRAAFVQSVARLQQGTSAAATTLLKAATVLKACGVDLDKLRNDLTEFLDKDLAGLATDRPGDPHSPYRYVTQVVPSILHHRLFVFVRVDPNGISGGHGKEIDRVRADRGLHIVPHR